MTPRPNRFKVRLQAGAPSIGCWAALCSPYAAELVGHCGFDWVLIDGEHAPNDIPTITAQLQALAGTDSDALVRVPIGETWLIKQVLDAGAQTILVPMVHSADQARALVRAMRYPPEGERGVGHFLGRATRFGRIEGYQAQANDEVCLLVQIESSAGLEALDDILAIDGVDGVFLGPADLAADLGHADPGGSEMMDVLTDTLSRVSRSGKGAGIIALQDRQIEAFRAAGAQFIAVAADVLTLSRTLSATANRWRVGG